MKIFAIITLSILPYTTYSSEPELINLEPIKLNLSQINKTNDQNKKIGLWYETNGKNFSLCYYENGIKNGPVRYYVYSDSEDAYYLAYSSVYSNGFPTCPEYYFGETGLLSYVVLKKFQNTDFINIEYENFIDCSTNDIYQAYLQEYNINTGKLESEGWAILFNDFSDRILPVGQWTVFSDDGIKLVQQNSDLQPIVVITDK